MDDIIHSFMTLFRGRMDVHGSVEGKSNKEAVTETHYQLHLEGKRSLGVYPLLDDGYCHFAAVDIDEKDFDKALKARNILKDFGIAAYIAESKSKGYHVYVFAETRFLAKDIRWVLHSTLQKAGVAAEIFPKQDKLDEVIKYGNYINLPYFGVTRQFVTTGNIKLSLETAYPRIVRVSEAILFETVKNLPIESPQIIPQNPKLRSKKTSHPPCILGIMKGVNQGMRDAAGFALARHHLDQGYTPEEVLSLLQVWDQRNKPPLGDIRVLQTKIQSAEKGYAFGCASVRDDGLLSQFCPGEDKCAWLTAITKERRKKGLIKEVSFYEDETMLYEEIVQDKKPSFVSFNKKTGEVGFISTIEVEGVTLMPAYSAAVIEGAVRLASGVEPFGTTQELVSRLKEHIDKYTDLAPNDLEFVTWYILMSWTYDRLPNVQYARFKGDTGTGKSRSLDVVGDLCYKPMVMSGAVTPAPIYRIIDKFRGTLVLDEADFSDSSYKSEVVTILNTGFEPGRPVIRCAFNNPDELLILPCFGPKVFATRGDFEDKALESRCMTINMLETAREDIPPYLGSKYQKAVRGLRNQLLLYRLTKRHLIDPEAGEDIDLGNIEPRLKQTGIPYAVSFKDDPEVMDRYKAYVHKRNLDLIDQRAESAPGRVLYAFLKAASMMGKQFVTASAVGKICQEELKLDLKPTTIGKILSSLGIKSGKKRTAGSQARYYQWEDKVMKSLRRRYFPDDEDFEVLFTGLEM